MTNYYNAHRSVVVNDSMILELTNRYLTEDPTDNFMSCNVIVTSIGSRRILMHFLSLEISFDDQSVDRLHIYDYQTDGKATQITPPQGLYGLFDVYYHGRSRGVEDYMSTSDRLKLDYQGHPTLAYDGFKILITTFKDAHGECGRGYFLCKRKKICIPASTWCDGFRNCGNDDDTDESNCYIDPTGGWNPVDGTIMAVVAASVSCTIFLLAIGVVFCVLQKLNKMDKQNRSISVYFHKKNPKRQTSNNGEMVRLYAPPSYDVVIGMDEQPPPYHSVAGGDDSGSDVEDGASCSEYARTRHESDISDSADIQEQRKRNNKQSVRITAALVTCDIEGNIPPCANSSSKPTDEDPSHLKQTKYRLTSCSPPNVLPDKTVCSNGHGSAEIEVLSSADSLENIDKKGKRQSANPRNSNAKKSKSNGHARVSYTRSPSKRAETANIDFINNEEEE